eukprot:436156_1
MSGYTTVPLYYPNQIPQCQPVSYAYPPIIQQRQTDTISNQYQKKRNASHLAIQSPSKRQKSNHIFNQHDITNYKNYLQCILTIIRKTVQNHNHVKKHYKKGGLLSIKNLNKHAQKLERAHTCDPRLHYPVLCNAIKTVLHHIPVSYQEKIATQSGYKAIFDKYISKYIISAAPNILCSIHTYYEYTGGNKKNILKQFSQKRKKETKKSVRFQSLQQKLHDMTQKYEELMLRTTVKVRILKKEIEILKKDKIDACINTEKYSDNNEGNKDLKNVFQELHEENDTLQQENINLTEENFELKQIINDLELKHYLVSWEKSIKLNENSNNIEDIKIKKELNIENNNDFDEECIDYCEDNDIDDIIVTNDNLNDGIVRILNDNININWCPKCGS